MCQEGDSEYFTRLIGGFWGLKRPDSTFLKYFFRDGGFFKTEMTWTREMFVRNKRWHLFSFPSSCNYLSSGFSRGFFSISGLPVIAKYPAKCLILHLDGIRKRNQRLKCKTKAQNSKRGESQSSFLHYLVWQVPEVMVNSFFGISESVSLLFCESMGRVFWRKSSQ